MPLSDPQIGSVWMLRKALDCSQCKYPFSTLLYCPFLCASRHELDRFWRPDRFAIARSMCVPKEDYRDFLVPQITVPVVFPS